MSVMLRTNFVRFNADWEVVGKRCVANPACCGRTVVCNGNELSDTLYVTFRYPLVPPSPGPPVTECRSVFERYGQTTIPLLFAGRSNEQGVGSEQNLGSACVYRLHLDPYTDNGQFRTLRLAGNPRFEPIPIELIQTAFILDIIVQVTAPTPQPSPPPSTRLDIMCSVIIGDQAAGGEHLFESVYNAGVGGIDLDVGSADLELVPQQYAPPCGIMVAEVSF